MNETLNEGLNDKDLQEAFASLQGPTPDLKPCPPDEDIWAALELSLPVERRLDVIDHLAECPRCSETWRLAAKLGAGPPGLLTRWARSVQSFLDTPAVLGTLATAALALIAVITIPSLPTAPPEIAPPSAVQATAERGRILSELPANQALSRSACVLRWQGFEGATYELLVLDTDSAPLFKAHGLREPQQLIAEQDLADLAPGAQIQWLVVATLESGEKIESETIISTID